MTLHTIILRDNRIQHIMPASAYAKLSGVKDTDKTFKVFLKSRKWADAHIADSVDFGDPETLNDLREIDQQVYQAALAGPVTKSQIQRALSLSYHFVRDSLNRLHNKSLVEKIGVHEWVARS